MLTKNGVHQVGGIGFQPVILERQAGSLSHVTFGKLQHADGKLFVHRVFYDTPKKKNGMELVDYATGTVLPSSYYQILLID